MCSASFSLCVTKMMLHPLWVSLLPFLLIRSPLGRLVFVNGFLAHGVKSRPLVVWDILCNVCMSVYVALTATWQPATDVCILAALLVWQYNRRHGNRPLVHCLGVQMPMLLASIYF